MDLFGGLPPAKTTKSSSITGSGAGGLFDGLPASSSEGSTGGASGGLFSDLPPETKGDTGTNSKRKAQAQDRPDVYVHALLAEAQDRLDRKKAAIEENIRPKYLGVRHSISQSLMLNH